MVYDAFLLFFELDLLEIRLNILDQYVDYFVIVESNKTFVGLDKPLFYQENKDRFRKWEHKIIHYVIDENDKTIKQMAVDNPATGNPNSPSYNYWLNNFYQMESVKKGLVSASDNDICYISDIDEIWRPGLEFDLDKDQICKPIQTTYMYYLNCRINGTSKQFNGTTITNYKTIRNNCLNDIKNTGLGKGKKSIENGGWHFEALGGGEQKINYIKHPEYASSINIEKSRRLQDYKGRNFVFWIDNKDLPKYINDNREKYDRYLITEDTMKKMCGHNEKI